MEQWGIETDDVAGVEAIGIERSRYPDQPICILGEKQN
jgi:hypothetical protein